MHDEDQGVPVIAEPEQLQPDRPLGAQVEGERREPRGVRLGVRLGAVAHRQVEGVVGDDVLERRPLVVLAVDGAQHHVPAQEGAQRLAERLGVERARHAHQQAHVVGGAGGERPVVQPHALLRVGQRGRTS
ncbi:hypothetical protein GCM10018952_17110 [Streptosporangium vulgare]